MVTVEEEIQPAEMLHILELCKKQSSDLVIIPQCPGLISPARGWNVCGTSANSIIADTTFDPIMIKGIKFLWRSPSVGYIACAYKDISGFCKCIRENRMEKLKLVINEYEVNGRKVGVATELKGIRTAMIFSRVAGEKQEKVPHLPLYPYMSDINMVRMTENKWYGSKVVGAIDLNRETDFQYVWNCKTNMGGKVWVPDICKYDDKMKPYVMYLSKTMFNFTRTDEVGLEIRNQIPGEDYNKFMVRFSVRRKGRVNTSTNNYYMMGILIVR